MRNSATVRLGDPGDNEALWQAITRAASQGTQISLRDELRLGACDRPYMEDQNLVERVVCLLALTPRCARDRNAVGDGESAAGCCMGLAVIAANCGENLDPCAVCAFLEARRRGLGYSDVEVCGGDHSVPTALKTAGGCCWALPASSACALLLPVVLTLVKMVVAPVRQVNATTDGACVCGLCEDDHGGDGFMDMLLCCVPAFMRRGWPRGERCTTLNGAVYSLWSVLGYTILLLPCLPCAPLACVLVLRCEEGVVVRWRRSGNVVRVPEPVQLVLGVCYMIPSMLPLMFSAPLAYGAAAVVRESAGLTRRILSDGSVAACVPRRLQTTRNADATTPEGCVLRSATLASVALGGLACAPCAATAAVTQLDLDNDTFQTCGQQRRLPTHVDKGATCCLCVLPAAVPVGLLATCALAGIKAFRALLPAPTFDTFTETALARCKSRRTVATLRERACSWDAETEALVVTGSAADAPLELSLCAGFPRLRVLGPDVVLLVSDAAHKLPDGTHVQRSLAIVARHSAAWDLPRDLSVGGDLYVHNLAPSRALAALHVGGSAFLVRDVGVPSISLGTDLVIGGQLSISSCSSLSIAEGQTELAFGLELPFSALEALPEGLRRVRGNLALYECGRITELPPGLVVDGDLRARNCEGLTGLPEGLDVGGALDLGGCSALARFPASVRVRGSLLDLSRCSALTSVPLEPLQQPREATLTVDVSDSGVAGDALRALVALNSERIHILTASADDAPSTMASLQDAERNFGVSEAALRRAIDPAYLRGVLRFLEKVLRAADARDPRLRDGLVARTREILQLVIDDAEAREELVLRMCDSVDACADKPAWALGQMQLVAMIVRARGDRERLRLLGRGVMRLAIVHDHAQRYLARVGGDDVSVMLRFEIALRESLQLPVSAQTMLYAAPVSNEVLARAQEEALSVSDVEFARWLETWEEWRRQRRLEAVVPYAQLAPFGGEMQDADDDADERVRDPVYALPDTANVWSYADLCAHWVRTGMDFSNGVVGVDEFAGSVVWRLSEDVAAAARVPLRESLRRRLSIFAKSSRKGNSGAQLAPAPQEDFER